MTFPVRELAKLINADPGAVESVCRHRNWRFEGHDLVAIPLNLDSETFINDCRNAPLEANMRLSR